MTLAEKVFALSAGPDLRRLLGRVVMGWDLAWIRQYNNGMMAAGDFKTSEECAAVCTDNQYPKLYWTLNNTPHIAFYDWRPDERIEDTYILIRRLETEGFWYGAHGPQTPGGLHCWAFFAGNACKSGKVYDESMELAACKAALLTKISEKDFVIY